MLCAHTQINTHANDYNVDGKAKAKGIDEDRGIMMSMRGSRSQRQLNKAYGSEQAIHMVDDTVAGMAVTGIYHMYACSFVPETMNRQYMADDTVAGMIL